MEARSAGDVKLGLADLLRSAPAFSVKGRCVPRVKWRLLAAVLLALAVGAAVHEGFPGRRAVGATHVRAHGLSYAGLLSLPVAAQGPVSATLGAEGQAYRVSRRGGRFTASSPVQHLSASFTRSGVSVRSGIAEAGLSLLAVGYGSTLAPVAQVAPSAHSNRVLYQYPGLDEWYANGPLGLEQGFTVAPAPARSAMEPLTVALALSGNVLPRLAERGHGLTLVQAGHTVLRYADLQASDSRGRVLRSWLALERGRIVLRVDTAGARYPLRIDPLIQQGEKLTGAGEIASGRFGYSVALSADGNTALIGARYDTPNGNEAGGAWVFTRSGSTWTQQGGKLNGTGHAGETLFDHIGEGEFGASVALSADGDTALIGAPRDNYYDGAVWVFTRSGSTWTQQGEKLTGTGEIGKGELGTSVVLSADGNTALIGGPANNSGVGAVWVFTRSGPTWTQQGEKLVGDCTSSCANEGTGETGEGKFGTSVALSEDGDTAMIGGWDDDNSKGAAWVFTRSGSTWTQQGEKLVGDCTSSCANEGTGETGEGRFGVSVALSADGNTALISGLDDNSTRGAVWLFTRSGSTWTEQGEKLTGGGEAGEGEFGTNVALSADGGTALIGGWRDNGGRGAAWVFVDLRTPTTGAATDVGETGATLTGTLGAGGSSTAYFQYGTSTAYGASTATQTIGPSSSPSPLAAAIGGLAPGTTYHFRLVADNSSGVVYGADQTFMTEARGVVSTTESTTTTPTQTTSSSPSVPSETLLPPPAVQDASQSTTRWREGNQLARVSRGKTPTGTTFSFQLNEQATVTFGFAQSVSGRKAGGKCVTQTKKNRRKPPCTRTVTAGTLTFTGHSGTNEMAFQGRISPVSRLKPGRYTLVITATNSAGAPSAPASLSFTIVK
jgi:hypothetical protein